MKSAFLFFFILFGFLHSAIAGLYVGGSLAHISADFRSVQIAGMANDVVGSMEMLGIQAGYENMSEGNIGGDFSFSILGVNSQSLRPDPGWGIPWFYKLTAKVNYLSSFGLYGYFGTDLIGNL